MARRLTIRNIGPLKEIDVNLNQINVFIGPQSSGKSTIAKIVSFCQWLEKDCVTRQSTGHVNKEYVDKHFLQYYNINSYITPLSKFAYFGEAVNINFNDDIIVLEKTDSFQDAFASKNAYIPAERNVLSVPGIFSTKMPYNYLLEFIDDWLLIRTKYSSDDKLSLLNLEEQYFFDSTANDDMLRLSSGKSIPLSQASSGLQSVTPLCVYVDYLTEWVYSHEEDRSAEDRRRYREVALARYLNRRHKGSAGIDMVSEVQKIEYGLSHPKFSNLVIEEPELNLFPETQIRLLYYIFAKIQHSRDTMILTTHSPYILYAINNCMLGSLASMNEAEISELVEIPKGAWVSPENVSVWEMKEGNIRENATIQDERGLIRGNYFDRVMHNIMADFHALINFIN